MTPPTLSELEHWMRWLVTDPRGPAEIVLNHPGESREKIGGRDWTEVIAARESNTPARRLDVYGDGYPARMFEALAETYPAVKRVLGDSAFLSLTGRYVAAHPPVHYSMGEVGRALPEFIAGDPLAVDLPFLPDLARLELAVMRAFHAKVEPLLSPETLHALDPEKFGELRLKFQSHIFLFDSPWPIGTIRELRAAPDDAVKVRVENSPEKVLVHRTGLGVHTRVLDPGEFRCLELLRSGATVWEVLEKVHADTGREPAAGEWFANWMSAGLVVSAS